MLWPSAPSIWVPASEPTDEALAAYGKPNAGVVFHRSCTVGLLLRLTP